MRRSRRRSWRISTNIRRSMMNLAFELRNIPVMILSMDFISRISRKISHILIILIFFRKFNWSKRLDVQYKTNMELGAYMKEISFKICKIKPIFYCTLELQLVKSWTQRKKKRSSGKWSRIETSNSKVKRLKLPRNHKRLHQTSLRGTRLLLQHYIRKSRCILPAPPPRSKVLHL